LGNRCIRRRYAERGHDCSEKIAANHRFPPWNRSWLIELRGPQNREIGQRRGGAISPDSQVKSQYETAALRHFDLPDDRCGVIFDRFSRTCLPVDVRLASATLALDGDERKAR
jgi:hypothetical protein